MHQNPTIADALAHDRVLALRQSARTSARASELGRRVTRPRRVTDAARRGTGWLLVDLGLRLAVPRSGRSA